MRDDFNIVNLAVKSHLKKRDFINGAFINDLSKYINLIITILKEPSRVISSE